MRLHFFHAPNRSRARARVKLVQKGLVGKAATHRAAAPADHAPAESAIGGNAPPEEKNARNAAQQQRGERRWKTHEELLNRPRADSPQRKFSRVARSRYDDDDDPQAADVGPNEWQLNMSHIDLMNDMVYRISIPMDVPAVLKPYWIWDYTKRI